MAKIGQFKNDRAREQYLRAYDELEKLWPAALPTTELEVETSFGTTHVRRCGSGQGVPLVLIHPISGNSLGWHRFIEELAGDRVVYALDTIGTAGKSVQTAPMTTGADYATWVDDVLTGLGLERVHLLGYSEGAWHGALVGAGISHRLASLTLGEPGAAVSQVRKSILFKMLWLAIRPTDKNFAKFNAWLSPGLVLTDSETRCAKASLGYRRRTPWQSPLTDAELQSIKTPTYAFFGSETVLADPETGAKRISDNVPHAETEIFPGGGHSLLWQMPETVVPRIMRFIRSHDK
ncbi:alpha/beta hydrolase [Rhodococcus sp. NPDC049939]|uniref:alpha/beta fold hydrolase n=1 Tax=Rhodococcus sp. NPDC049939 TaxID=3155511 RepID=UPI00340F497A